MKTRQIYPKTVGQQVISVSDPTAYEEDNPSVHKKDVLNTVLQNIVDKCGAEEKMGDNTKSGVKLGGIKVGTDLSGMSPVEVLDLILNPEYAVYAEPTAPTAVISVGDTIRLVGTNLSGITILGDPVVIKNYKQLAVTQQSQSSSTLLIKDNVNNTVIPGTQVTSPNVYTVSGSISYSGTDTLIKTNKGNDVAGKAGSTAGTLQEDATLYSLFLYTSGTDGATGQTTLKGSTKSADSKKITYKYPDFIVDTIAATTPKTTTEDNNNYYKSSDATYETNVKVHETLPAFIGDEENTKRFYIATLRTNYDPKLWDVMTGDYSAENNVYKCSNLSTWVYDADTATWSWKTGQSYVTYYYNGTKWVVAPQKQEDEETDFDLSGKLTKSYYIYISNNWFSDESLQMKL